MQKTTARKALESALAQATTVQDRSDIANRLSRLMERESRSRARRRREKAKRPPKPVENRDDSLDEFIMDPPAPQPLTPQASVAVVPAPQEPDNTEAHELEEAYRQHGDGSTRVISATNYPGATYWDPVRGAYFDDIEPQSSIGQGEWFPIAEDHIESDAYVIGEGFQSEIDRRAAEAEAEHFRDIREKMYSR